MKKIGFVIPWYGENIPGGAEAELRGLTKHLHREGVELEILTTRVKEFASDWSLNYYPEGIEVIKDIPVRRFNTYKRDANKFNVVNEKLMAQSMPSEQEEIIFMEEMVNSPDLYRYISEKKEEYSIFVYIPYMFGTTYYGIKACPEKAVMIPCFHNESYVYMNIFKELFPQVKGMLFHAKAEAELANRVYNLSEVKQEVLGGGIDTDWKGNPETFRTKYNIKDMYILYAGRKDAGKQVDMLIAFFSRYKHSHNNDLKLILIGGGEVDIPIEMQNEIIDLGFVDLQDKYDAYSASLALCQPSLMESFSIVIMESWIAKRPVIVNAECDVTSDFVKETGAGFEFADYNSFERAIEYLLENPEKADDMGETGYSYVMNNFNWKVIVDRAKAFFENLAE